jgi:hypothetical protein
MSRSQLRIAVSDSRVRVGGDGEWVEMLDVDENEAGAYRCIAQSEIRNKAGTNAETIEVTTVTLDRVVRVKSQLIDEMS